MVRLPETLLLIFHCSSIFVSFMFTNTCLGTVKTVEQQSLSSFRPAYRKVSTFFAPHPFLLRDEQNHSMLNLKAYASW